MKARYEKFTLENKINPLSINDVCTEIADIVSYLSKDLNVEGIYMIARTNNDYFKPNEFEPLVEIEVVAFTTTKGYNTKLSGLKMRVGQNIKTSSPSRSIDLGEVGISLIEAYTQTFSIKNMTNKELFKDMLNSRILYDPNGKLNELKNSLYKVGIYQTINLLEFENNTINKIKSLAGTVN